MQVKPVLATIAGPAAAVAAVVAVAEGEEAGFGGGGGGGGGRRYSETILNLFNFCHRMMVTPNHRGRISIEKTKRIQHKKDINIELRKGKILCPFNR
jgi:hypothetical protein